MFVTPIATQRSCNWLFLCESDPGWSSRKLLWTDQRCKPDPGWPPNLLPATTLPDHLSRHVRGHLALLRTAGHDVRDVRLRKHTAAGRVAKSSRLLQGARDLRMRCWTPGHCAARRAVDLLCFHVRSSDVCLATHTMLTRSGHALSCSLLLFLVFFRYTTAAVPDEELPSPATQPRWQTALFVAATCLVHGLLIIVLTSLFQSVWASQMPAWANFLGVMAAALAAVQYLPQIWTTYHLKHVGSLSIPMMIIQTPGGLLFAGSLFARLGWGGWSSWGIFLLSALMQGILLGLAIYYEIERRAEVDEDGSHTTSRPEGEDETLAPPHDTNGQVDEAGRNERAPLLKSSNNGNAHRSYDTNQG
jgi:hypothetical protein